MKHFNTAMELFNEINFNYMYYYNSLYLLEKLNSKALFNQ